jgi:branched-chain amino acid transport system substrate-binding protein
MYYMFYHPFLSINLTSVMYYKARFGTPPGFPAFHAYTTAHFIADAYSQAGKIDKEKFIDALEGLKVDSPVGKVEMRACDHQAFFRCFGTPRSPGIWGAVARHQPCGG